MMTREEAIEYAESKKMRLEALVYNDDCKYGNYAMYSGELSFVNAALSALRPVSREQVEKVWRGEWNNINPAVLKNGVSWVCRCAKCGCPQDYKHNFCPNCGAAQTDEAVDMVMERMEEMKNG